jgi:hypothetical protein
MRDPKQLAAALQHMGRRGDTILAHLNPREAALLNKVTDGGTVNPKTGLLEFNEDDWGGQVNESTPGGGEGAPSDWSSNWSDERNDIAPVGSNSSQIGLQGQANNPSNGLNFSRDGSFDMDTPTGIPTGAGPNIFERGGHLIQNKITDAIHNPARSAIDFLIGGIPILGWANTISGLLGGPTVGKGLTSAARELTNYDGAGTGVATGEHDPSDVNLMQTAAGGDTGGYMAPATGAAYAQPAAQAPVPMAPYSPTGSGFVPTVGGGFNSFGTVPLANALFNYRR